MRLVRGELVAGLEPELARTVARLCHGRSVSAGALADRTGLPVEVARGHLAALTEAGFLREITDRQAESAPRVEEYAAGEDFDTTMFWTTTLSGGALTMASFLKPISKAKAKALVDGVLERAAAYNADRVNPLVITELRVFGSYVADVPEVGDVDLHVTFARRYSAEVWDRACAEHARATGHRARSFVDQLFWPEQHLKRTLKNRSGYLHVHDERLEYVTTTWEVLYTHPAPDLQESTAAGGTTP